MSKAQNRIVDNLSEMMKMKLSMRSSENTTAAWRHSSNEYLFKRLDAEVAELKRAVETARHSDTVLAEAADVANFAAMIADNFKPIPRN